jgi:hypothetical protein
MVALSRTFILSVFTAVELVFATRGVDQAIATLEKDKSPLLQYPTQYTQGIVPKAIHSHNDCMRFNEKYEVLKH